MILLYYININALHCLLNALLRRKKMPLYIERKLFQNTISKCYFLQITISHKMKNHTKTKPNAFKS